MPIDYSKWDKFVEDEEDAWDDHPCREPLAVWDIERLARNFHEEDKGNARARGHSSDLLLLVLQKCDFLTLLYELRSHYQIFEAP